MPPEDRRWIGIAALFLPAITGFLRRLAGKTGGEAAVFRVVGYAGAAFSVPVAAIGAGADHGFVVGAVCVFHMREILRQV